jgi:hypothetical protein
MLISAETFSHTEFCIFLFQYSLFIIVSEISLAPDSLFYHHVGFEVLAVVVMKCSIFWNKSSRKLGLNQMVSTATCLPLAFTLASTSVYLWTLKMEATCSFETVCPSVISQKKNITLYFTINFILTLQCNANKRLQIQYIVISVYVHMFHAIILNPKFNLNYIPGLLSSVSMVH